MKSLLMMPAAVLLVIILLFHMLPIAVADAQLTQNNTTMSTTGDQFTFIINVRGITEYNKDKLAVVITSGDAIESKIVDRSKAVSPPGTEDEPFSNEPKMVDT